MNSQPLALAALLLPLAVGCTAVPYAEPRAAESEFQVVVLENASAPQLAENLQELLSDAAEPESASVTVVADVRTNSLLLRGPSPRLEEVLDLVAALDVKR